MSRIARLLPVLMNNRSVTLPQYLLTVTGEVWGDFEDHNDWTVSGVGASVATNSTAGEFRAGASSVTLTSGVGVAGQMYHDYSSRVFASAIPRCRLMVYLYAADVDNIDRISLLIGKSNYSNYMEQPFVYTSFNFVAGWNTLEVKTGTGYWGGGDATTGYARVRVTLTPKAGQQVHASFDSLVVDIIGVPAVGLMFDDGINNAYTNAYGYMKTKRARGTAYINTNIINTAGYLTTAQMQEMYGAGWAIANHSNADTNLTTITEAEVETLLTGAKTILDGLAMPRSTLQVAYPSCGLNETVLKAMRDVSMTTGRSCYTGGKSPALDANFDQALIMPIAMFADGTTTLAAMQTVIDLALANKYVVLICFHGIVAGGVTPANFNALVDYIVARNIPFVTIDDIWSSLSGPVTVPIA